MWFCVNLGVVWLTAPQYLFCAPFMKFHPSGRPPSSAWLSPLPWHCPESTSGWKSGWSPGSPLLSPFSQSSHSRDASCPISEHSRVFSFFQFSGCWQWEGWSTTSSSLVARVRNACSVFSSWSLLVWRNTVDSCSFYESWKCPDLFHHACQFLWIILISYGAILMPLISFSCPIAQPSTPIVCWPVVGIRHAYLLPSLEVSLLNVMVTLRSWYYVLLRWKVPFLVVWGFLS